MDPIDKGCEQEQKFRELAHQYRKPTGPLPCGRCHNCNEPLDGDLRWCDKYCLEDWQARQRSHTEAPQS